MADDNDKKNLASSGGIADLLGITPNDGSNPSTRNSEPMASAPSNLPTGSGLDVPQEAPNPPAPTPSSPPPEPIVTPEAFQPKPGRSVFSVVKSLLPYIVVFVIAIGLYFFYFSSFSFTSLFKDSALRLESLTSEDRDKNLEELKEKVGDDYREWIGQFFVDVNDESIISMDADVSGNGLTNLEKYLLNLNPKVFSTRGNMSDGQAVIEGINPWTGKTFTEKQKELVDKYINKELISNRITAAAITRGVTKYAQYVNTDSPYYIDPQTLEELPPGTPVMVDPSPIPTVPPSQQPNTPPTVLRNEEAIDTSKPGRLDIPANNISVPLTWTKDVKDFDADLKKGIVHYPGTALPGEVGTAYISGHSSGYLWDKSPYKQIFSTLGQVETGTSFTITATQNNGKTVKFNYVVERRGEFAANDQAQFISTAESMVALSTCWPVGTVDRRLVLFAKLTQTERN